jgi:two-component system response regulator AtoC
VRERNSLRRQNALLQRDLTRATGDPPIVAASDAMIDLLEAMERTAGFKSPAFLVGEAGTGKETLARAIHAQSPRHRGAFVAVRCGSIREAEFEVRLFGGARAAAAGSRVNRAQRGLLADADGGTLFLDEIGRLALDTQKKILRVLEQEEWSVIGDDKARRIDVRVIAASSRDLSAEVAAGRFLPELLERLLVHRLAIPSLRERSKDIPLLFDHSISDDALQRIVRYSWPGNLRELANLVECAVILADGPRITATELPDRLVASPDAADGEKPHGFALKPARKALEARIIRRALRATDGNRTHAAKLLDISHRALLYKIKEFGIRDLPPGFGR